MYSKGQNVQLGFIVFQKGQCRQHGINVHCRDHCVQPRSLGTEGIIVYCRDLCVQPGSLGCGDHCVHAVKVYVYGRGNFVQHFFMFDALQKQFDRHFN